MPRFLTVCFFLGAFLLVTGSTDLPHFQHTAPLRASLPARLDERLCRDSFVSIAFAFCWSRYASCKRMQNDQRHTGSARLNVQGLLQTIDAVDHDLTNRRMLRRFPVSSKAAEQC